MGILSICFNSRAHNAPPQERVRKNDGVIFPIFHIPLSHETPACDPPALSSLPEVCTCYFFRYTSAIDEKYSLFVRR